MWLKSAIGPDFGMSCFLVRKPTLTGGLLSLGRTMNTSPSNSKTASGSPSAVSAAKKKLQETLSRDLVQAQQVRETLWILKDAGPVWRSLRNDVPRYSKIILGMIGSGHLIALTLFAIIYWKFEYRRFPQVENQLGKIQTSISNLESLVAQIRPPQTQALIFEAEDGRRYILMNRKVIFTRENKTFVEITTVRAKEDRR